MRLGAIMGWAGSTGEPLEPATLADTARAIEAHGFDSAWVFDALGRGFLLPDPLMALAVAATVTDHIELGTGVMQVPLRSSFDLAQRVATAALVADGRLLLGLGAGSTRDDFVACGADFGRRMATFGQRTGELRALLAGDAVNDQRLGRWPALGAGPQILIGSWAGSRWIERAGRDFDGWIGSAAKTSWRTLSEGVARFRAAGGRRAVVTNIAVDLDVAADAMAEDDQAVDLRCTPAQAAQRLARLGDLGFDDAVLVVARPDGPSLTALRALL